MSPRIDSVSGSSKLTAALLAVSLVAVGSVLYLATGDAAPTPAAHPEPRSLTTPSAPSASPSSTPTPAPSSSTPAKPRATTTKPAPARTVYVRGTDRYIAGTDRTTVNTVTVVDKATSSSASRPISCSSFTWQQDAQAAYVANLSDPYGLDGAPGPHNGDGLACVQLPVDPSRAASIPIDAYVPTAGSVASKAALAAPSTDYFGFIKDGLPNDIPAAATLAKEAGKTPSSVGWFAGFDTGYDATKVQAAWTAGQLPVITWMSKALSTNQPDSTYTLKLIASGALDPYLQRYAGDVVHLGLPVVLRFDHEMNGNWYPWAAGLYNNTPALYVAAWRHIWTVFQNVGANDDVIWLWSPSRTERITPGKKGQTGLSQDYPGDQYVDWVGASVYMRYANQYQPTYADNFGVTVAALKAVSSRPLFFAEVGAVDDSTGSLKSTFIADVLPGLTADPRIVGFLWNDNDAPQTINGVYADYDWRIESTLAAQTAFADGVKSARYAAGKVTAD